jgi:CxxC-x17-CxxC domain-containing protein
MVSLQKYKICDIVSFVMNNFRTNGPGGPRNRPEFIGGRPKSDADYSTKKRFDKKPAFGNNRGGDRKSFGGSRGSDRRETEMFKTTCTTCGRPAEVPFRPDGSKPVLCRDCFSGQAGGRDDFQKRDRFTPAGADRRPERKFDSPRPDRGPSPDFKALQEQVRTLEGKLDEVLTLLKNKAEVKEIVAKEKVKKVLPTTMAEVAVPKKVVVKKVSAKKVTEKVAKTVAKKAVKKVAKKTAK